MLSLSVQVAGVFGWRRSGALPASAAGIAGWRAIVVVARLDGSASPVVAPINAIAADAAIARLNPWAYDWGEA